MGLAFDSRDTDLTQGAFKHLEQAEEAEDSGAFTMKLSDFV